MQNKGQIKRREFLNKGVMAVAGITCIGPWSQTIAKLNHGRFPPPSLNGRGHTMVIVGTQTPFLSHQPMFGTRGFNSPYRYQVILEANFGKSQPAYEEARLADQRNTTRTLYTFDPGDLVLTDLNRRSAPRTQITGAIYRQVLGQDIAEPVVENVQATVRKIYFQEFSARLKKSGQLGYLMFGKMPEIFMAHLITRPPDFDHLVALKVIDASSVQNFSQDLTRGLRVTITRTNLVDFRPTPKQGPLVAQVNVIAKDKPKIEFQVVEPELYLEEGELRVPPKYATTTSEKDAGFS